MKLVYMVGIDGAGKTTVARRLVEQMQQQGVRGRYFYAQHASVLLAPLRWLNRKTFMRKTDAYQDYDSYASRKAGASQKHPLLARGYAFVWLLDYFLFTYSRLLLQALAAPHWLVVDRYYLDIVVNISQTLGLDEAGMLVLARQASRFFLRPAVTVFIDVSEETAMRRKDDVPDIAYLKERRGRYLALEHLSGFVRLDGEQPLQTVLAGAQRCLGMRPEEAQ